MNDQSPLVSVIIATFNQAEYLREALSSVQFQTYTNWEAIIVNNFSTDNTVEIVNGIEDDRFQLIPFRNHGIIGASRNVGIRKARGDIIAFLDSDDTWYPDKLEKCVEVMLEGFALVSHGLVWTVENGTSQDRIFGSAEDAVYDKLLYKGNCIASSATVVRKSIVDEVGGFSENPEFITAEDYELWLRFSEATNLFFFIPRTLGIYRVHSANESSTSKHMHAILAVVDHHHLRSGQKNFWKWSKYRQRRSRITASHGWRLSQSTDYRSALRHYWKAILNSPFYWNVYGAILITSSLWIKKLCFDGGKKLFLHALCPGRFTQSE